MPGPRPKIRITGLHAKQQWRVAVHKPVIRIRLVMNIKPLLFIAKQEWLVSDQRGERMPLSQVGHANVSSCLDVALDSSLFVVFQYYHNKKSRYHTTVIKL